jgi:pimeloyl-ACP methyl ester carboxylesterase
LADNRKPFKQNDIMLPVEYIQTEELHSEEKLTNIPFSLKEESVIIDGLRINYTIAGEGSPLLILHGWGGSHASWKIVQKKLAGSGYYVVCPDLPGFGNSDDPPIAWDSRDYSRFLEHFIEEIDLKEFSLLGHSMGGGLATRFTAEHRDKVKILVLCDAAVLINRRKLNLRQKVAFALTEWGYDLFSIPFFARTLYRPAREILGRMTGIHDYYLARGPMKESFKLIMKEDLSGFAPQIDIPTLLIWGKNDKTILLKDGLQLEQIIPASKLKIIDKADHNPHKNTPEILCHLIRNFLEEVSLNRQIIE